NDEINPYIYTETFHGRDIMMPIGAYLSKGVLPKEFGPKKPILSVVLDLLPDLSLDERFLKGKILYIDSFGNIITNIHIPYFRSIMVSQPILQLDYGEEKYPLRHVPTFAGNNKYDYLLIDGSSGFIEICQNQSNAAESLDAHVEDEFTIEFLGGLLH
ncbi:MAG: SAM hydroxide adenosyltransferase, partial [Promethearchaeota archaeon]